MKVDIEGFELKMIRGGLKFLSKYQPSIVMEINKGALEQQGAAPQDIFKALRELGYFIGIADGDVGSPQYDIFATKRK